MITWNAASARPCSVSIVGSHRSGNSPSNEMTWRTAEVARSGDDPAPHRDRLGTAAAHRRLGPHAQLDPHFLDLAGRGGLEGDAALERSADTERRWVQPDRAGEALRLRVGLGVERELCDVHDARPEQRGRLEDPHDHRDRWIEAADVEVRPDLPLDAEFGRLERRRAEPRHGELEHHLARLAGGEGRRTQDGHRLGRQCRAALHRLGPGVAFRVRRRAVVPPAFRPAERDPRPADRCVTLGGDVQRAVDEPAGQELRPVESELEVVAARGSAC